MQKNKKKRNEMIFKWENIFLFIFYFFKFIVVTVYCWCFPNVLYKSVCVIYVCIFMNNCVGVYKCFMLFERKLFAYFLQKEKNEIL